MNKLHFENLFREHYSALCKYALGIIGDNDQSKDVVQQAFIKLWEKRETMDVSRSLKSYLYTSVRNACINYIRDQKKFRSSILDVEIYGTENIGQTLKMPDQFLEKELIDKIEQALGKLPEKSLQVFKMSRNEQMKYREIAEKLDVTVKTVEAHMSKALKILRHELGEYLTLLLLFATDFQLMIW